MNIFRPRVSKTIKKILKKGSTVPLYFITVHKCEKLKNTNQKYNKKYVSYKVLTIVFAILSGFNSFSQDDIFLNYYENVNIAEMNIVNKKLDSAIYFYDLAFPLTEKPMVKDIHNALMCAVSIKNNSKTQDYLEKITLKNLNPNYYKRYKLTKYLTKNQFKNIKERYKRKINSYVYQFLDSLQNEDQKIRTQENYLKFHYKIIATDTSNYNCYIKFLENNDFPDESQTINYPNQQRIDNILFHHWFQTTHWFQMQKNNVDSLIIKQIKEFNIANYHYANFYDIRNGSFVGKPNYGMVFFVKYKHNVKLLNFSKEDLIQINKNRKDLGLDTRENSIIKTSFFDKSKIFIFQNYGQTIIFSGGKTAEEQFNSLK
ncbi:MAG: hypothetical protein LBV69_09220 [Bacteroidales bacterium]|jgi:hypothetical protein|nr:hypothetical protein [Bacteroidales bacterium]